MSATTASPAATVNHVPPTTAIQPREIEILLGALAKDLLARQGRDFVRIDAGEVSLLIARVPCGESLERWPEDLSAEEKAELDRRLATAGEGRLLFEFMDEDDDEPRAPSQ